MLAQPNLLDYPFVVLVLSFFLSWVSAMAGGYFHDRYSKNEKQEWHEDYLLLIGGTLTLLGLLIGFTFAMAASRYDQRKNYEEEEANAIGTEYLRADFMPPPDAEKVRGLLVSYLRQRLIYYRNRQERALRQSADETAQLQSEIWATVAAYGSAQSSSPVASLVVSGMNDVFNSQGYTQASWWNRVPTAAWFLLISISVFCNALIGYGTQPRSAFRLLILPIALSISLFLIADIDSPRGGVIRVAPNNLQSLFDSLHSP
jgi:hypothetical protein